MLPDCGLQRALDIANDLRESFSAISFETTSGSFNSTFSCGVAALPMYQDVATLGKAADDALYQAKHSGRNRVVTLANSPSTGS